MNFLRQPPDGEARFSLNGAVEMCLDVARPVLRRSEIEVRKRLSPDLPMCRGELILVRQAVLNLIYNACQAMQGEAGLRRIVVETRLQGDTLLLAVEDSGPGVPFKDRERIFGTMYTTKGRDGTGLGLTVVRNVMHRHGGTVRLVSSEGRGARFELQFPLTQTETRE
jgi:signal transduction histidine kinase